ncbi:MAG: acetate--CoA ligase family protein [Oceanospirillaceae bacterium]|nr:acetate--CoA ligase family protein [Oceanospirillaceae bacterium]
MLNTHFVSDESGITEIEGQVGFPAAIKIIHQEYCHPFAYGKNPVTAGGLWQQVCVIKDALLQAAKGLREELSNRYPFSRVHGFSVQPVRKGMDATQFSMGITRDEHFGPLIFVWWWWRNCEYPGGPPDRNAASE